EISREAKAMRLELNTERFFEEVKFTLQRVEWWVMKEAASARVAVEVARRADWQEALEFFDKPSSAVRRDVAKYLAESGRADEALEALNSGSSEDEDSPAQLAVVNALVDQGRPERALEVARSMTDEALRTVGLGRVVSHLVGAGRQAEAAEVARELKLPVQEAWTNTAQDAVEAVAAALLDTGQRTVLLETIRREWMGATDMSQLANRLLLM